VPPDIASSGEILLQEPLYRTVLVNGSRNFGVRFYPLNAEQDFGEAHAEVRWSSNVTAYGSKSENNFLVLWIRDSDRVTVHGYGGNASPFANTSAYHAGWIGGPTGYAQFMPSLFRVQRCVRRARRAHQRAAHRSSQLTPCLSFAAQRRSSTNVRFANLIGDERGLKLSQFVAAGNGTDPRTWNMVLRQDGEGVCDAVKTPSLCATTRVLDRPVLWEWRGQRAGAAEQ
jgi:hypothetical protein